MNDQEMQFADPEWQSQQETYGQRPVDGDPQKQWREFPPQQEAPYGYPEAYPYPEQGWGGAGKLKPRPRKRRYLWLWLLAGVLIIALSSQFRMHHEEHPEFSPPLSQTRYFPIESDAHPVIEISDGAGNIHVHVGDGSAVIIQANAQGGGFGERPAVRYNQDDDDNGVIRADAENESDFPGSGRVDFDVTVPSGADLTLKTGSGEIDVSGVSGQMSLTSDTGSIHASQDVLTGESTLQTDTGSITFDGSLDPSGSYQFQTNTGTVTVTLPDTPPFHVDATAGRGTINTNFPELTVQQSADTGAELHGDVGASPGATVTLQTDSGIITLNKR